MEAEGADDRVGAAVGPARPVVTAVHGNGGCVEVDVVPLQWKDLGAAQLECEGDEPRGAIGLVLRDRKDPLGLLDGEGIGLHPGRRRYCGPVCDVADDQVACEGVVEDSAEYPSHLAERRRSRPLARHSGKELIQMVLAQVSEPDLADPRDDDAFEDQPATISGTRLSALPGDVGKPVADPFADGFNRLAGCWRSVPLGPLALEVGHVRQDYRSGLAADVSAVAACKRLAEFMVTHPCQRPS